MTRKRINLSYEQMRENAELVLNYPDSAIPEAESLACQVLDLLDELESKKRQGIVSRLYRWLVSTYQNVGEQITPDIRGLGGISENTQSSAGN